MTCATNFQKCRDFPLLILNVCAYLPRNTQDFTIGAQAVHQLPWGYIVVLLHRVANQVQRHWYAVQTI